MTSPMPPTSNMRASMRRAKAGGERFLGGMMAGATSRRLQVKAFADEWAAANIVARHAVGPLWVVLGDSTSQGTGATTREVGYVGVVHEVLRRRAAWRVINLSRAGAGVADVLARQLPELTELTEEEPAALVTCIVGAEDVARRLGGTDIALRTMCAAMPRGAVIGTVPLVGPAADTANAVLREEVVRHGLRLADLSAVKGAPTRGREAIRLGDVGHAALAKIMVAAIDNPAPNSDPTPPEGIPQVAATADGDG
jgi:lysophospholipase L1-like esterase